MIYGDRGAYLEKDGTVIFLGHLPKEPNKIRERIYEREQKKPGLLELVNTLSALHTNAKQYANDPETDTTRDILPQNYNQE